MRIHEVEIENFRGIKRLAWRPPAGLTSLIGPGDSGKTTILDALGLVFSPRWGHVFTDNDFHGAPGGADDIVIRATVVDPPRELLRLEAFAGYVRGVNSDTGEIVDEPDDEDPALTVELRVDRYLEPVWQVVAARQPDPTPLKANQRATFGVVRIGSDSVTDLRWSRSSALLRMTGVAEHKTTPVPDSRRGRRRDHAKSRDGVAVAGSALVPLGGYGRVAIHTPPGGTGSGSDAPVVMTSTVTAPLLGVKVSLPS